MWEGASTKASICLLVKKLHDDPSPFDIEGNLGIDDLQDPFCPGGLEVDGLQCMLPELEPI